MGFDCIQRLNLGLDHGFHQTAGHLLQDRVRFPFCQYSSFIHKGESMKTGGFIHIGGRDQRRNAPLAQQLGEDGPEIPS